MATGRVEEAVADVLAVLVATTVVVLATVIVLVVTSEEVLVATGVLVVTSVDVLIWTIVLVVDVAPDATGSDDEYNTGAFPPAGTGVAALGSIYESVTSDKTGEDIPRAEVSVALY